MQILIYMKFYLFIFITILTGQAVFSTTKNFDITIQVKGIKNDFALLAYHYETSRFVQDTIQFNDKGIASIKGNKNYPDGVYIIAFPTLDFKFFDLIINKETKFSLTTDTIDLPMNMKVSNSIENEALYNNLKYSIPLGFKIDSLKKLLKDLPDSSKTYKNIIEKIETQTKLTNEHRASVIEKYPNTFYASLLKMMQAPEPIIPKSYYTKNKEWKDTVTTVSYIKEHYFDIIDWSDSAYVRSPIFKQFINQYFDLYIFPLPDSIIPPLDNLIAKAAQGSPLMYKYVFNIVYDKYSKSQIMGYDRIFVHLVDKYLGNGKTPWIEGDQLKKINDYAEDIRPVLIGNPAADFTFKDSNYVDIKFHALLDKAEYTILVFWNSDCGHCQHDIPLINAKYDSLKTLGAQVVSISTEQTDSTFRAFAAKNCNLNWITGWDPNGTSAFRREYFINATPKVFIIDRKEQKIRAKNLPIADLYGYLEFLKNKEKE